MSLGIKPAMRAGIACHLLLPVNTAGKDPHGHSLRRMIVTLRQALAAARDSVAGGVIHVYYNGPRPPSVVAPLEMLQSLPHFSVRTSYSPTASKIAAVNAGLREAEADGADLLLCVDDDVLLPDHAIRQLVRTYRSRGAPGAAAAKAPLVHARSTPFQRLYSYAVQASFEHDLAPKRPTGSLYCVDPHAIGAFPAGSNEGDYLDQLGVPLAGVAVRSEYPQSFDEEVQRRSRLLEASASLGYDRMHDHADFVRDLGRIRRLPPSVDRSTHAASVNIWAAVRAVVRSQQR